MAAEQPWYLANYQDKFSSKGTQRIVPKVTEVLAAETVQRNADRDLTHFHPSELSKNDWCARASYYRLTSTEESDPETNFSFKRLNTFTAGHDIHDKWQRWMWLTGNLVGTWRCKDCGNGWMDKSPSNCPECGSERIRYNEVHIFDEELHIYGRADGEWEDEHGRALVEVKSVGLGTIRWDAPDLYSGYEKGELTLDDLWKRIKRPLLPHRRQINLYMHCRKVDKAIVIYEWKPSQEVKEFHLTYDPDLVKPMLDGCKTVLDAIDHGVVPSRPDNARKGGMCKFCPFKTNCWKD